jgi:hypothetical protein
MDVFCTRRSLSTLSKLGLIGVVVAGLVAPTSASRAAAASLPTCTIAAPSLQATVEARLPDAADFCELVAQALAAEVFHAPVAVAQGRLWHYPDALLDCKLQFRNTHDRLTIHNAMPACAWFMQRRSGWHRIPRRAVFSSRSDCRAHRGDCDGAPG